MYSFGTYGGIGVWWSVPRQAVSDSQLTSALGITLMSLGMAIVTVLRSLVTDMVPHQHVTLIYSMMTMMMRIGSGVAGPVFAWSFGLGMRLGSGWTGLPFLISAILFLAGTIALAFISRSPQKEKSTVDNEELYA